MMIQQLSRRDFLTALGVGVGGLTLTTNMAFVNAKKPQASGVFAPNLYVSIAPTGWVTVVVHRSEMGQGIRTSIAMLVAEELNADWAKVVVRQAPGDAAFGDQNTDGSRSIRRFYGPLRMAGATAREMLISAAAKKWKVARKRCVAKKHEVVDAVTGKTLGFGELAPLAAKLKVPKSEAVELKPRSAFQIIGKSKPLIDGADIVRGAAQFGADIRLSGMLVAVIERPPAVGDEIVSIDDSATLASSGVVKVVQLPSKNLPTGFAPLGGVAVIAKNTWAALRGRKVLKISWKPSEHRSYNSRDYRRQLEVSAAAPGEVARDQGDVTKALAKAKTIVRADYYVPHLAQAPMEPPVALAWVQGNRCEVWASVQTPQAAREEVAQALAIPLANVTINVTLLGGGFGRKSKPDFVTEAALLSRSVGAPVRVQWTRTDDLRHSFFHTVSAQHVEGGLDEHGRVVAWHHRTAFPTIGGTFNAKARSPGASELGMGLTDLPFAIDNIRVEGCDASPHVRIGWMRSVANIYHGFAVGSFVDELAAAAKRDPKKMWLELCSQISPLEMSKLGIARPWNYGEKDANHPIDPRRLSTVIERVCERASWNKLRAQGRAVGLAAHRSFASYVATVIEVSREPRPRLLAAHSVIDAGQIVSHDRVLAQLEGAITFGLSIAVHGEISIASGQVEQSNFHDYPMMRMNEVPAVIDVDIVDSSRLPGGVGEPGVPPVTAAYANAIFNATGKRFRSLPIGPQLVNRLANAQRARK